MNTHNAIGAVDKINEHLQSKPWFDFEVMEYRGCRLTIMGSIDSSMPHTFEIWFEGVFFFSGQMEWRTNTSTPPMSILMGENAISFNRKFRVEQGHHLFRFAVEDDSDTFGCVLAAREIGYMRV